MAIFWGDALRIAQTEAKATAEHTAQALDVIKNELKNTIELVQQSAVNMQQNGNKMATKWQHSRGGEGSGLDCHRGG
jgi:hypothetical protein